MVVFPILALVLGYLLGSIPSAYLIGRFWGKTDLRHQGDGHVSATAVYREVGRTAFLVVIVMDVVKGIVAILLAKQLAVSPPWLVATACATVIGHCWSVFIRFNGGLGAVVTYAVLFTIAMWEFFVGSAVAIVLFATTRKSSLSTYVLLGTACVMLAIERKDLAVIMLPPALILIQLVKRFQIRKTSSATGYKNELFDDLKRVK